MVDGITVNMKYGKSLSLTVADSSSEYQDEVDTTDNNFNKAMKVLNSHFGDINKVG